MFVSVLSGIVILLGTCTQANSYSSQKGDGLRFKDYKSTYHNKQNEISSRMISTVEPELDRSLPSVQSAQSRFIGTVNLDSIYNFLTSDATIVQMYVTVIVQFITQTVGWLVTSLMWNTARGTDPGALDLGALQTFAFSPQSAATSTAIGLGYTIATTFVNLVIGSIGGISTVNRESTDRIGNQGGLDYLLTQIDTKTKLQNIGNQTWINFSLTLGFILFWYAMSLMPSSNRRRSQDPTILHGHQILDSALHFVDSINQWG